MVFQDLPVGFHVNWWEGKALLVASRRLAQDAADEETYEVEEGQPPLSLVWDPNFG